MTGEGVDVKSAANVVDPRLPDFLVQWLNINVMTTPLKTLPDDLIASQGKLAFEALESMCGRKV